MSNINDRATVSLFVNGEQAEDAMDRMRQKAADLDKQLKAALAAGDAKSAKKLQRELDKVSKELNRAESAAKGTGIVLDNLSNTSIHGLRNALKYLEKQLSMTKPNTDVWREYAEQIQEVKERIEELNGEIDGGNSLWDKFKEWSESAWPALDLINQWYDSIIGALRGFVDAFASMDQEMASVRKFTGMTEEQVYELNEKFKKIDTRSSREQLNLLAQEAGRLGLSSQEDVLGFVRAADKINVALDDLGNGATLTLSKLTDIFGDKDRFGVEQSLLKVGSVINELSQSCSASAPYIANFASRLGGVGAQANLTVPQIMALGAVLDSTGQKVEASATAVSQVLVRMMQDPGKYAKVAGLEVEEFARLLREDANEALLTFLEALNNAGDMDVLAPMFSEIGENGSRAIAALATLSKNIDLVRRKQHEANVAFREGVSIDSEFEVQNTTVAASLEKCKNRANELKVTLGEKLYPVARYLLTSTAALIKALGITINFIADNKGVILSLVLAITTYIVTVNLAVIKQKLWNATLVAWKGIVIGCQVATKLFAVVIALMTGNVVKARAAWIAFSTALKLSPIGLMASAIVGLIALLVTLAMRTAKATAETNRLAEAKRKIADVEKEAEASCAVEIASLDTLYKATQDQNLAMDQRLAAVRKLQEQYPEYFKNLTREAILAGDAAEAYDRLRRNIVRSAQAQARKDLLADTEKEILIAQRELREKERDALSGVRDLTPAEQSLYGWGDYGKEGLINDPRHPEFYIIRNYLAGVRKEYAEKIAQLETERELLYDGVSRDVLEDAQTLTPTAASFADSDEDTKTTDRFAKEKEWREQQEASARISYATGETDYLEHTKRMNAIAVEFCEKQLLHTDLTETEKLKITANWREAQKKQAEQDAAESIEAENTRYDTQIAQLKQFYIDGLISKEAYDQKMEEAEIEHQCKLVSATAEGSADRLKAESALQNLLLDQTKRKQREREAPESKYSAMKKDYFGDNPQEAQEKYDEAFEMLRVVYDRELAAAGDNATEKLRIEEAFEKAKLALKKKYGLLAEEDTRNAMARGVADSIEWLNSDGGKAITASLDALVSGMSAVFSQLSSLLQAEMEIQTASIEKRYDAEVNAAQGNSYKVAKLEKQKEQDVAKVKNDANRKLFAMQVIQAVAQTVQNALAAYGSAAQVPMIGYILAPIAAAMAVAAGAIQIAAIKKQQQASEAQGYSKGGFTKPGPVDEPAGIVHAGEWVASQKLLANPVARPMIEALDLAQRTNTIGSLKAEDVSRSIRANDSLARIAEDDSPGALMVAAALKNAQAISSLVERLNEPFVTVNTVVGDYGIKQAQEEHLRLMNNVTPKSKRK